jgi:hypothetical protein
MKLLKFELPLGDWQGYRVVVTFHGPVLSKKQMP